MKYIKIIKLIGFYTKYTGFTIKTHLYSVKESVNVKMTTAIGYPS